MFPELSSIGIRRRKAGMTQSAFAKAVGISQSMLTKIERGKTVPSYKIAVEIFNKLEGIEHQGEKVAREFMNKKVIALDSADSVAEAARLAKQHSISQFPVVSKGKIVGSTSTLDLIVLPKEAKVGWSLKPPFPTVHEETPLSTIRSLLTTGPAVVVVRKDQII
ncbi:MAG: helix-turn-helix domain-containing protein, partial [Candidatus Micrarchaeota archaeon]|nr:helix-turn-helix domain-containing protein [Candidatus Micrarchaeota archaeon]